MEELVIADNEEIVNDCNEEILNECECYKCKRVVTESSILKDDIYLVFSLILNTAKEAINDLDRDELIGLTTVCKSFNYIFSNILYDKCHTCRCQIQDEWNLIADVARNEAFYEMERHGSLSEHADIWKQEIVECNTFQGEQHHISVRYYRFPRDVDILSWYINGRKVAYTML